MSARNPFATANMAEGYAKSRPAVHAHILARAYHLLQLNGLYSTALDVGCGAGISTKPLLPLARHCIGIEPAESMLQWATQTAPGA